MRAHLRVLVTVEKPATKTTHNFSCHVYGGWGEQQRQIGKVEHIDQCFLIHQHTLNFSLIVRRSIGFGTSERYGPAISGYASTTGVANMLAMRLGTKVARYKSGKVGS
jgi:hypothetical protein